MAELTTIGGIGPALAERLERAGVRSVEDLLRKGATVAGRKEMSERAIVDPVQLLGFVRRAHMLQTLADRQPAERVAGLRDNGPEC